MSVLKPLGVLVGMGAFTGSHMALSHEPTRQELIQRYGKRKSIASHPISNDSSMECCVFDENVEKFMGLYSLAAAGTLFPTLLFYLRYARGSGPQLWEGQSRFARTMSFGFRALGAITLSQAIVQPNPIQETMMKKNAQELEQEQSKESSDTPAVNQEESAVNVQGIYRITRHALFFSFALLGVGKLFTHGALADVFFWGTFPAFWAYGSHHQDQRIQKTLPPEFFEQTSLWPFQAIYEKRQDWNKCKEELDKKAIAVALMAPIFFL